MDNNEQSKSSHFSFKERLTLTLLLALGAPFMIFVTGVIDIFANNSAEFQFVLWDFILWNALFALCLSAVIVAILLPLRGSAFDIVFSILFFFAFMLFVQGNYLNFGLTSLSNDGTSTITVGNTVVNTLIWLAAGVGLFFAVKIFISKKRDIIKTVATVALIAIIGIQLISTVTVALSSDAFLTKEDKVTQNGETFEGNHVLSYKNITSLGKERNVVYFVVDRFDYRFYEQALTECPEVFDELDGFVCYEDAVSLYPRTYPSIPYLLSGIEQDFSMSRGEYFNHAYKNSPFLSALVGAGYDINIYSDSFYAYGTAKQLPFADNAITEGAYYTVENAHELGMDMALVSMFRYFPYLAKLLITVSTPSFSKYVKYDSEYPRYTTDMRDLYLSLNEKSASLDGDKRFTFIHFSGTHTPYLYDEDFNEATSSVSTMSALKQSFKIINRYIEQMKRLGVYDDATIVITADHASIGTDHEPPLNPHTIPIFFKASGSTGDGFTKNAAPVAQENIIPAVLKSEGLTVENLPRALGDIAEGETLVRRYLFQCRDRQVSTKYVQYEYEIIGSARDYSNWVIKKSYPLSVNIYA